jgi:hypothetical protein
VAVGQPLGHQRVARPPYWHLGGGLATPIWLDGGGRATPKVPIGWPSHPLVPKGMAETTPSGYRRWLSHPYGAKALPNLTLTLALAPSSGPPSSSRILASCPPPFPTTLGLPLCWCLMPQSS